MRRLFLCLIPLVFAIPVSAGRLRVLIETDIGGDADAMGETVHVVLEATDDGTPALARYRRAVVTGKCDENRFSRRFAD